MLLQTWFVVGEPEGHRLIELQSAAAQLTELLSKWNHRIDRVDGGAARALDHEPHDWYPEVMTKPFPANSSAIAPVSPNDLGVMTLQQPATSPTAIIFIASP